MKRKLTREIKIGDRVIGGNNPIAIQSMTNIPTENTEGNIKQILDLEKAGCEIIRLTVPTKEAAESFGKIKKAVHIPCVADIHLIIRWLLLQSKTVRIRFVLTPVISEVRKSYLKL